MLRHSAEYIKFLAPFFNLEEKALEGFSDTVASYTARMESAANGPLVAWIRKDWSGNYELSQATRVTFLGSCDSLQPCSHLELPVEFLAPNGYISRSGSSQ